MEETAEDVLTLTDISEDDRKKFDLVIAKFDSFFTKSTRMSYLSMHASIIVPKRTMSRQKFIITSQLVENCEYGALTGSNEP